MKIRRPILAQCHHLNMGEWEILPIRRLEIKSISSSNRFSNKILLKLKKRNGRTLAKFDCLKLKTIHKCFFCIKAEHWDLPFIGAEKTLNFMNSLQLKLQKPLSINLHVPFFAQRIYCMENRSFLDELKEYFGFLAQLFNEKFRQLDWRWSVWRVGGRRPQLG